jgi:hypothetical protein
MLTLAAHVTRSCQKINRYRILIGKTSEGNCPLDSRRKCWKNSIFKIAVRERCFEGGSGNVSGLGSYPLLSW